jgi:hypothetical protein
MAEPTAPWRNRIVGHRNADPNELKAHPMNWRTHPEPQAAGLRAVLDQVGVVQDVIVSKATGRILDGHLRVEAAIATGQPTIPVVEVEVTEEEERLVLATFDPLGGMAGVNADMLTSLVQQLPAFDGALGSMLEGLSGKKFDPAKEWQDMPECVQEDISAYRQILISFHDDAAVEEFARRLGIPCTEATRYAWFPTEEQDKVANLRVKAEGE